jgi:hypothetical protein
VKKLMPGLDIAIFTQILVAVANFAMAFVMLLSIREIRRDRKRSYLEKRLEEFYIPLINLFSHGNLKRDYHIHDKVEEIIVSKRHLCGKKVATILPQHFTAVRTSNEDFYFRFSDEEELKKWVKVADTIWEEYVDVLKEYYKIIGIKHYVLPEKPKWMFKEAEYKLIERIPIKDH